jgi:type II secretory pathway component PulK
MRGKSMISKTKPGGSALVLVFWIVAILGLAVFAAVRIVAFDLEVVSSQVQGARAKHLAEMGIAIGANPAVERDDPLLKGTLDESGEGYSVQLRSEANRLNLNAILLRDDKSLLRSLFVDWGMKLDDAEDTADALADWIDQDDEVALNGAESDYYKNLGRLNQPFNRPFYNLGEVRLVRGIELLERLNPDWQEAFTLWSSGSLDVNEAEPELLAAAAEVSYDRAVAVIDAVLGPDRLRDTEDDVRFNDLEEVLDLLNVPDIMRPIVTPRLTLNDTTTRIESTGRSGSAARKVTLIVRNRTGRPAILDKFEEVLP